MAILGCWNWERFLQSEAKKIKRFNTRLPLMRNVNRFKTFPPGSAKTKSRVNLHKFKFISSARITLIQCCAFVFSKIVYQMFFR